MRLLRILPLALAILHASFVVLIFGLAMSNPGRLGLLPILVFYVDYPSSIAAESLRRYLHSTLADQLLVDAVVYGAVGSIWFFLIGLLVRAGVKRFFIKPSVAA